MSFNYLVYKHLNQDLKLTTPHKLEKHYIENGKKESRKHSVYELYPDFNPLIYQKNYSDLENLTVFELELHWLVTGSKEERSYYNILSDINRMSLVITDESNSVKEVSSNWMESIDEIEKFLYGDTKKIEEKKLDKNIVVLVNNNYDLDFVEVEKYVYVINELLKNLAYVVQEDEKELTNNSYIKYIVNISAGDLLTQKYVQENIQYMEENEIFVLKPNCFYYIGENQVYRISTNNLNMFIESGIIYKKGYNISDSQYINNTNHELMIKHLKNENEILNDGIYDYEISDNNMMKAICRESNVQTMIQVLTGVKNKKAYITFLDMNRLDYDYMLRLQLSVTKLLQYDFDIIEIHQISNYQMESYELILLDANVFNIKSTKLQHSIVCGYLSVLEKCKNNYIITHDLHDWSFGFANKPQEYEYSGGVSYPCNKMTTQKMQLKSLLTSLNIRSIISIYDCPEFEYMKESFNDVISNFYTLHHFISTPIYHLPKVMTKNIDVLFYGVNDTTYYLFRHRLLNIVKDHFDVTQINRKSGFDPEICEHGLANYISRSWITLSCVSNFSYAVRKFNEISECGSVVLANTNNQIDHIIGEGMLRVDENMSDDDIISIIKKHLDKKIILVYLGFKSRKSVERFNDNNYILSLRNIIEYDKSVLYPEINVVTKKLKKSFRKKINNNSFILDHIGDLLIEIELINNNILDNRIGCFIKSEYYRSVIINDNYYIYIDDSKGQIDIKLLTDQNIQTVVFYVFDY
jgi:hypothetical protein